MEIEVGKEYITADGNIVKVINKNVDCWYPYFTNIDLTYNKDGKYWNTGTSKRDLICEVVPSIYALYSSGIIDLKELIKQHIEYYTK